jgi:hypothetical protein
LYDDEELDDDDDSEYDSMTSNSIGDDAEEESSTEDVADPHNYAKLVDSELLEDDEPAVSYRVDWVKGKGAGRKTIKGRSPKPDTTLMSAAEAKDALDHWEKDWKRDTDKLRRNRQSNDGCSFVDGGSVALNQKNISMNALCRPKKQATRTSVGFHARTTMITPFLVDARVEFRVQMAFHAITCALWSSRTELRA